MKYKPVYKPYPHQWEALEFLIRKRGGGLQVPMRWGKTKVAIDFANCMAYREGITKVLVLCPLSVCGVWDREVDTHTPPDWPYELEWCILNFDQVFDREMNGRDWYVVPSEWLESWVDGNTLVIVDESHHIGNPGAARSQYTYRLGRKAKLRVFMTGTMFHRKPFYVFGQVKFYGPEVFGTSFGAFKQRIADIGSYRSKYEIVRYKNLKWMVRKMKKFTYMQEYVPPRDTAINVLTFPLTGRGKKAYKTMERESIFTFDDGDEVISPIILSKRLRCQQITGGWLKLEDGRYRRVGSDKLNMALDRFAEYADQDIDKVVVGCRFIPELYDASYAARKAGYKVLLMHGGLTGQARTDRIHAFQTTTDKVMLICQIAAAKEGVNLDAASVMCFYSLPESFLDYDQFRHRIWNFKDDRTLMFDYLIATGTLDEVAYEALAQQQDVAQFIIKHPKRVERITAKTEMV